MTASVSLPSHAFHRINVEKSTHHIIFHLCSGVRSLMFMTCKKPGAPLEKKIFFAPSENAAYIVSASEIPLHNGLARVSYGNDSNNNISNNDFRLLAAQVIAITQKYSGYADRMAFGHTRDNVTWAILVFMHIPFIIIITIIYEYILHRFCVGNATSYTYIYSCSFDIWMKIYSRSRCQNRWRFRHLMEIATKWFRSLIYAKCFTSLH